MLLTEINEKIFYISDYLINADQPKNIDLFTILLFFLLC
jgi:hypothetical protein